MSYMVRVALAASGKSLQVWVQRMGLKTEIDDDAGGKILRINRFLD